MSLSFFKIYSQFIEWCSFPLMFIVSYYCKRNKIHAYAQVAFMLVTLPIHLLVMIPGFIIGVIFGLPYTIYKYSYYKCNSKSIERDGST